MFVVLALTALPGAAHAAEQGQITLSMGTAALAGETASVGIAGSSMLGFAISDRTRILVGGREGLATGAPRVVGSVNVAVATDLSDHWYLRGGFVHHHETPWAEFTADPLGSLVGAGEGIEHRSGGDLGLGYVWHLPAVSTSGVHYGIWLSAVAFPDAGGPHVYGVLEHEITLDFGKRSS